MADKTYDSYLEKHLDTYMQELKTLVSQPSVSAKNEGLEEMADLVYETFKNRGYQVSLHQTDGAPIVHAFLPGKSKRTLLFYNHYDVQPAEPFDLWDSPPFEPEIRDGKFYGRGSKDDKGEMLARISAVDAIRDANGGELPCGIRFVVEGQEEISSPHIAQFVRDHLDELRADASIWEEGGVGRHEGMVNLLGNRGILAVKLSVRTLNLDAHSGAAHNLPNAAWRLLRALSMLKNEDQRVQIPEFYDDCIPPNERDLEILQSSPDMENATKAHYGFENAVGNTTGLEYKKALFNPTCNIQGITTGYQGPGTKTVIPAVASAKLDFRLVPDQDPEKILANMRAHLDARGFTDVEIKTYGMMWPAKFDPDDPFVQLVNRTAEEVYGHPTQMVPMSGGSSPKYAFARPLGNIPICRAGIGYWNSSMHAPNEHFRLQDFLNCGKHLVRVIDQFTELFEE